MQPTITVSEERPTLQQDIEKRPEFKRWVATVGASSDFTLLVWEEGIHYRSIGVRSDGRVWSAEKVEA
jgi:hypothetical protein